MTDTTTPTRPAHTRGPWHARGADGYAHVGGGNPVFKIADVSCGRPERAEDRANARLIAAAPDLYDAAENALDTLLSCCVAGDGVDDREAMLEAQQMLRAAIAKATGSAS